MDTLVIVSHTIVFGIISTNLANYGAPSVLKFPLNTWFLYYELIVWHLASGTTPGLGAQACFWVWIKIGHPNNWWVCPNMEYEKRLVIIILSIQNPILVLQKAN